MICNLTHPQLPMAMDGHGFHGTEEGTNRVEVGRVHHALVVHSNLCWTLAKLETKITPKHETWVCLNLGT